MGLQPREPEEQPWAWAQKWPAGRNGSSLARKAGGTQGLTLCAVVREPGMDVPWDLRSVEGHQEQGAVWGRWQPGAVFLQAVGLGAALQQRSWAGGSEKRSEGLATGIWAPCSETHSRACSSVSTSAARGLSCPPPPGRPPVLNEH